MKAIVFAAGLGTRLYPITESIPKALVEVGGKPMLLRVLEKLRDAGINEIVINVPIKSTRAKYTLNSSFFKNKNGFFCIITLYCRLKLAPAKNIKIRIIQVI